MRVVCDETDGGIVWRLRLAAGERDEIVITAAGIDRLAGLLDAAERCSTCRVLVLEGSRGSFCQGMDLEGVTGGARDGVDAALGQYAGCLARLRACSKPLLALVDGTVFAGGMGLAAAADVVLATERSVFGLPEVTIGLVPAMVLPVLLERMPAQKARRLALSAASIDARQAFSLGLVDRLVRDEAELERALRAELRNLLRTEPGAAAALKRFATQAASLGLREGLSAGCELTAERLGRAETRQAIRTFLEGEPQPWFARPRARRAR